MYSESEPELETESEPESEHESEYDQEPSLGKRKRVRSPRIRKPFKRGRHSLPTLEDTMADTARQHKTPDNDRDVQNFQNLMSGIITRLCHWAKSASSDEITAWFKLLRMRQKYLGR